MRRVPDIDSDDEEPDLRVVFEDCGFEYDVIKVISPHSSQVIFYHIHLDKFHILKPNFFRVCMNKIKDMMERKAEETQEQALCQALGDICVLPPYEGIKINIEYARSYFARPLAEQETIVYFQYKSPKRGLVETEPLKIPYAMSEESLKSLEFLA
mmetsp:Transcript_30059/g.45936  ORF Transcript_30059/g.45936 Transcript_30059/m.45936 type:complete len:155 (-) Transcript_30059:49-513(-)